jgi:hypothetical protein
MEEFPTENSLSGAPVIIRQGSIPVVIEDLVRENGVERAWWPAVRGSGHRQCKDVIHMDGAAFMTPHEKNGRLRSADQEHELMSPQYWSNHLQSDNANPL